MTVLLFWVLFAVACGVYASNRGRSGIGWFFLSLVISPLLGLIFIAVSKDLSKSSTAAQPGTGTHVKCPACAEFVLLEARVCKHCGAPLVPAVNHVQNQLRQIKEAEAKDTTNLIIGIVFIMALFAVAGMISKFTG